jgi:hypothetical protein
MAYGRSAGLLRENRPQLAGCALVCGGTGVVGGGRKKKAPFFALRAAGLNLASEDADQAFAVVYPFGIWSCG